MNKSEEILDKHLEDADVKHIIGKYSITYNACLSAVEEAINYTHCCTELPTKQKSCINGIDSDTCRHNGVCDYC
jgi:hypothetical protein